jgi:hypothetical protein
MREMPLLPFCTPQRRDHPYCRNVGIRSPWRCQLRCDVADPGGMVALFCEVPHGGIDNSSPLGLGSGSGRNLSAITGRTGQIRSYAAHNIDLKSGNDTEK